MTTIGGRAAFLIGAVAGAGAWIAVAAVTGRREAWDTGIYFSAVLPGLAILAAVLGFLAPVRAWRWGFAPFAGQALVAFLRQPDAGLLPLGLIVFAVYGALMSLPALAGSSLRRRFDPTSSVTGP